jgi:integrase
MAFIRKSERTKYWRICWYDDIDGKLHSESSKTTIEAEAKSKAKKKTHELALKIRNSNLVKPGDEKFKFSDAFKLFLQQHQHKPKTIKAYTIAFNHFKAAVDDKPLYKFNKFDNFNFRTYLSNRTFPVMKKDKNGNWIKDRDKMLSDNSKANYTEHVFAIFEWLRKNEFVSRNYIQKFGKKKLEVKIIPYEDLQKIFTDILKTNKEHYEIIKTIFLAGLRATEIFNIRKSDIKIKEGILSLQNDKGNRRDKIPMIDDLKEHLETVISLHAAAPYDKFLFKGTYAGIKSLFARSNARLGLHYHLHQLRSTRASQLAEIISNPLFLQMFMRHENIQTTLKYYVNLNVQKARESINQNMKDDKKLAV